MLALVRELRAALAERDAQVAELEARIRDLEAQLQAAGRQGVPGVKSTEAPQRPAQPRKPRARGYGRQRSRPTHRVVHALDTCPRCHCGLVGGWIHRRREVLEVVPTPVCVVEHVYLARQCPRCRRRYVPPADLGQRVLGRGRLGLGLLSLIATLREEARVPVRTIQWYLDKVHGLHLSVGAIVGACHQVARHGQPAVDRIRTAIRASPGVHADETGWRENGRNGYVWTFSTPTARYFVRRGRGKGVVDEVLGPAFTGVLSCDFYAAYHHYDGLKQRCWAHLLREIHELRVAYPADASVQAWARQIGALYRQAVAFAAAAALPTTRDAARMRVRARRRFERVLLAVCQPHLDPPEGEERPQRRLCARIERHLAELFVFVLDPRIPPDNNAAERSLRHLVTSRKISGGTRSPHGTDTKMLLSSLFGTWRAQGHNPLLVCRDLLRSPQV